VRTGFNFSDDLCHDFLSGHYRRPLGLKICPPPRIADQLRLRDLRIQGPWAIVLDLTFVFRLGNLFMHTFYFYAYKRFLKFLRI
jgi:hypothetical protein